MDQAQAVGNGKGAEGQGEILPGLAEYGDQSPEAEKEQEDDHEPEAHGPGEEVHPVEIVLHVVVVGDGKAVMSCSHSFSPSNLYSYTIGSPDGTFVQDGKEIPLYILDSRKQIGRLRMPHMSEDIEIKDGKVLVGFESSARKMLSGLVPCSLRNVMIVPLPHEL